MGTEIGSGLAGERPYVAAEALFSPRQLPLIAHVLTSSSSPRPALVAVPATPTVDNRLKGHDVHLLCAHVVVGKFDSALDALAGTELDGDTATALTALSDVVVHELIRRAADLFDDLAFRAVHALGISPLTSEQMLVDADRTLHLIAERVPNADAIGEDLHTACGQTLWSDLEAPVQAGMRGSWQAPGPYEVRCCPVCAQHAARYPDTAEHPGDPELAPAVAAGLSAVVSAQVRAWAAAHLSQLAAVGAVAALDAAEERYREELIAALVIAAAAGGETVLQRALLRYYETAQCELRAGGYIGPLAALISDEDWQEVVSNLLEDVAEDGSCAVAQSYLYGELRSLLSERIRTLRSA